MKSASRRVTDNHMPLRMSVSRRREREQRRRAAFPSFSHIMSAQFVGNIPSKTTTCECRNGCCSLNVLCISGFYFGGSDEETRSTSPNAGIGMPSTCMMWPHELVNRPVVEVIVTHSAEVTSPEQILQSDSRTLCTSCSSTTC